MNKERQTYQQVSEVIERDLRKLSNKKLNEIDFQEYFYNLKQKNPKRYERLKFTNSGKPYSEDLGDILADLKGEVFGTRLYIMKKQ
jgi:hypothetical protein